jgi:hypothetical protein
VAELTTHLDSWVSKTRGVKIDDVALRLEFAEATKAAIHSAVHAHTPTDNEGRGCYAVIAFVIAESKQREAFKIPKMRVPANKAKQTQLVRRRPSDDEPTDNDGRGCYAVIAFVIAESKQREAFKIPKMRVPANKAKQTQLVRRRAAGPSDDKQTVYEQ